MTTTDPSTSPVDQGRLRELRDLFGDADEIPELFRDFFKDVPNRLSTLEAAFDDGDAETIERTAHALSGSSGSLGAAAVHQAAKNLEESARLRILDETEHQLQELEFEVARLRDWLLHEGLLPAA